MLRLSGTKLHFSTAYHPQSDGQTEVRNRGLEQYLRAFTADRPSIWANFLPWAELALNCFYHEGLGTSPFHALYGRHPPSLVAAQPSSSTPPVVADLIKARGDLLVDLRHNLERAQQKMRDVANRHRRDVQFEVGDMVLLKLQQYRQHSVARPLSSKLARRFYGPFAITERVGPVAYRLQLPDGARIHDVFHVSLLRRFIAGSTAVQIADLPPEFKGSRPITKPLKLLDQRVALWQGKPTEQALVQWSADGSVPPSWEPMDVVRQQFPLLLEDKELSEEGGVDTGRATPTEKEVEDPSSIDLVEREVAEKGIQEEERKKKDERSKRSRRAPDRYGDFVPY